jgi:hypothetical protein
LHPKWRTGRGLPAFLAVAALTFAAACLAQPSYADDEPVYATGAIPLSPEEFAKLPKTPTYRAFLPERVDLSSRFPRPGDQGKQGSCTAWAVGYAARAYYVGTASGSQSLRDRSNIPSPAYIYDSIRNEDKGCQSGSSIIKALNLLQGGALSLKDFPYHDKVCRRPSAEQREGASRFRIKDWRAVDFSNADQVKGELAKGNPIVISLAATRKLERLHGPKVYDVVQSDPEGWHAVTLVGYDEDRQAFRFINSWSTRWGDHGFGWISYRSFHTQVREAYVMHPDIPVPTPAPPAPAPVVVPPQPSPAPEPNPEPQPVHLPVVKDIGCGHVDLVRRDGKMTFKGFVGSDKDLEKLAGQAKAQDVAMDVAVRPWPQCELLLTLDKPLSLSDRPAVKIEAEKLDQGSHLIFSIRTPDYPSFLHVAYIQADGSVVNLVQPDSLTLKETPPNQTIRLGALDRPGPKFRVTPPFGREMLVAIASRAPLFGKPLPVKETEREFLTELRKAIVARPDPTAPDRVVSAAYAGVITSASKLVIPVPGP